MRSAGSFAMASTLRRSLADRGGASALFEATLLAIVALLPIVRVHATFRSYVIPPIDFLFPIAVLAFATAVLAGQRRWRFLPVYVPLAGYAVALTVATLASEDIGRSAIKLLGNYYLFGLAVLTASYVDSLAAARRLVNAWLIGAAVCVSAGLAGLAWFVAGATEPTTNPFLDVHGSLPPGTYPRVMATFINSNVLACYLTATTALLLASNRVQWMTLRPFRWLFGATLVVAAFSWSPGLGGLVLVLGWWGASVLRPTRPRRARVLFSAALIAAGLFGVAVVVSPFGTSGPSPRVLTWTSAWRTFVAHPWLGRGLGLESADVRYTNASGIVEALTDAHNTWLSVLSQCGLLGGVALIVLVSWLLRAGSTTFGEPRRTIARGAWLALVGGFVYQTLSGSYENMRFVWVVIGLLAALSAPSRFADDSFDHPADGQA